MTRDVEGVAGRDREVLNELAACHDSRYPIAWARPLDCGGSNSSDHSYRLSKMVKAGLVESRQRSAHMSRGSKEYRITEAGRVALDRANEALRAHLLAQDKSQ